MQIYHYHPATGEYLGEGSADESPLEPGAYLVPAHATTTAPPTAMSGKVRVWRGGWQFEDVVAGQPLDPEYEPSLKEVKAAKLTRINEAKNVALDGGFVHDGVLFDSDINARAAYLELAYKFGQDPLYVKEGWKASTGVWVTMDAALFAALQPDYEAHIDGCFVWQHAREMEIAAAMALEDEAEVSAALAAVSEVMG